MNNSRKRHPQSVAEQRRRSHIKQKYGLTMAEYDAIIARGCAICGSREGRMALDHCHETGRVRDALCLACNTGLGGFRDDPERLRKAIAYLDLHTTSLRLMEVS